METITIGSRVTACDCLLPGRISMVWRVPRGRDPDLRPPTSVLRFYRVQFPPHSPFIGDWAVYRQGEIALVIEQPPLVNVVDLMRPKIPTNTK